MSQSYTATDFEESMRIAGVKLSDIDEVLYAFGKDGGCLAEWSGGFVVLLKDGRFARVTGWCDTTGWGCQDGADVEYMDSLQAEWDEGDICPEDLNRVVREARESDGV